VKNAILNINMKKNKKQFKIKTTHKLYSVSEIAHKKQISRQAVLKQISKGRLLAFKVGNYWILIS